MFDRGDLALLILWFGVSLTSFAAIYLVVRKIGWSQDGSLFLNTWCVWLSWIASTAFVAFAGAYFASELEFFRFLDFWPFLFIIVFLMFLAGVIVVAGTMKILSERRTAAIFTSPVQTSVTPYSVVLGEAIVTNLIVWCSAFGGMVLAGLTMNIYEHFFPLKSPFAIY